MDPLATLARIRVLTARLRRCHDDQDVRDLVDLVEALDEWRRRGGFDPWERERFLAERRGA